MSESASNFTSAQRAALEDAYQKLGEHFDGVLIVVMANLEPEDGSECQECVRSYFAGGRTLAVGLAEEAKHTIQNFGSVRQEP